MKCINLKICFFKFMFIYRIFYPIAYLGLGIYLMYIAGKTNPYENLRMWISYLMQPAGILHPYASITIDSHMRYVFAGYFIGSLFFWFSVYKLMTINIDINSFLGAFLGVFIAFFILLFLPSQLFYALKFGECAYYVKHDVCENENGCSDAQSSAAYFFMLVAGPALIRVQNDFELLKNKNITCGGHINELRHYGYFSSAIGGIINLIILCIIVCSLGICIHSVLFQECWDYVKENHPDVFKPSKVPSNDSKVKIELIENIYNIV